MCVLSSSPLCRLNCKVLFATKQACLMILLMYWILGLQKVIAAIGVVDLFCSLNSLQTQVKIG